MDKSLKEKNINSSVSRLEEDLADVLQPDGTISRVSELLAQLSTMDKQVVITSYPACDSKAIHAGME